MARLYLLLTILGVIIPFGALVPWLIDNGLNLVALFNAAISNPISIFAWLDVLVSAIVLLLFITVDGENNKVKHYWLAIVATLTIGVSCGFPLYLYLKENQLIQPKLTNT